MTEGQVGILTEVAGNITIIHTCDVDQHALEFNPHTNIVYAGNDGGLYKYMST